MHLYNVGLLLFSLLAWSPIVLGGSGYQIFGVACLIIMSCLALFSFFCNHHIALRFTRESFYVFISSTILFIIVILSNLKSGAAPPLNDIIGYISFPYLLFIANAIPFKLMHSILIFLAKGSVVYVLLIACSLYFGIGISVEKVSNIDRLASNVGFNSLAFHLGAAGVFSVLYLAKKPIAIRFLWVLFVAYLISMTSSRTALIAFILSSFFCFSGELKYYKSSLLALLSKILFTLLLLAALIFIFNYAFYRGSDESQLDFLSGRTLIWFNVLSKMFYSDFIIGVGSSNIEEYINMNHITSVHNLYLQILAEAGATGLFFLFIIIHNLFRLTMKLDYEFGAIKATLIFLFLNGFTESRYFGVGGIGSFVITFACVYILIATVRKKYNLNHDQ